VVKNRRDGLEYQRAVVGPSRWQHERIGPFWLALEWPFDVGVAVCAGTLATRGGLTFIRSTMDSTVRAYDLRSGEVKWSQELPGNAQATLMTYQSSKTGKQYLIVTVPNPSWRHPRDLNSGTYSDSQSVEDSKGGYVITYAIDGESTAH